MPNNLQKISKKELGSILGVSYPTALKEYKYLLSVLSLSRSYLTLSDIKKYYNL